MERSYIAFISYKHTERDAAIAKQVHTLIENYVIPKSLRKGSKKLGVVFRDEEELPISSDLTESICTALDASRYLIVICSPEAKESPWVAREVSYFLKNHDASNAFVVLAKGEPNDVFPYELTHILNEENGEYQEVEPLAMDVRADTIAASLKKAKANIKKLYAGMLDCSYDSLVQREKTRKMKRLVALAAVCALLVGSFIGMLFVKNQELSQKNDELTAAIELALRRESELLVEQADEALQEGDVAAAFRYASDALSSEDVDRPYYSAAERALFSAVDVLQEEPDSPLIEKIALKHRAPIEMMAYNADGSIVYTIDTYGTVNGFDAESGALIWNTKIRDAEESAGYGAKPQIYYDEESNVVVCYYAKTFAGLDASTGKLLWENVTENTAVSGIYHDAEEHRLGYIERCYIFDRENMMNSAYEYNLIVFSMRDGCVLNQVPFERLRENSMKLGSARFGDYDYNLTSGMFTDSNGFVGTVFFTEDEVETALFYSVDLSENTVIFAENDIYNMDMRYIRTIYAGNDRALVLNRKASTNPDTGFVIYELWMQCFDVKSGSILWENGAEIKENTGFRFSDAECFFVREENDVRLGICENMYVVDKETGEIKASAELKAGVIDMHPIVDGLFGFTLEDGYCAIGWSNDNGMHDSNFYSATVDLPDTSDIVSYNGGLIQVYFTDRMIDSFDILPRKEGGGSVTYLSEDRCTAYVASVLSNPVLPEPVLVKSKDSPADYLGEFVDTNLRGKALLARTTKLNVVDTENHSYETIELEDYESLFNPEYYLTSDGESVIVCTEDGIIRIIGMDGTTTSIAERETTTVKFTSNIEWVDDVYQADAARQADGRIVAARTDGKQLTCWFDGGEETSVQLPEGVCWSVVDNVVIRSMTRVGENGLMVLSDFVSEDKAEIENFLVYDLAGKKWKQIPDAVHGSEERLLAFAETSPVFAVYDADMNIRVYNWNATEVTHCINTELPMVSVLKIGMLLDDQYVYLLTKDGQFIIYSVETGELVYRTILMKTSRAESFSNWLDRENERLYLRTDLNGLCIDMRGWEQLLSVEDFKFFNAAQNEVYVGVYDLQTQTYFMKAIPIPTTSELIGIVNDVIR